MRSGRSMMILLAIAWAFGAPRLVLAATTSVDLSGYRAGGGVGVQHVGDELRISWPSPSFGSQPGNLVLDLRPGQPLIRSLGISPSAALKNADPATFLLVGTREAPEGRPPGMSVFNVFFDSPARRPFQAYRSRLDLTR